MKRIVLATGNAGKAKEFAELLGETFQLELQTDLGLIPADETGTTFLENALLKARYAAEQSGMPAIADDSGLEVDALDGDPGVYSARYAGPDATDADNNAKLIKALADVPAEERAARFRCVVVYVRSADDPEPIVADGFWNGAIEFAPRGVGGFGYDPLFCDFSSGNPVNAANIEAATTAAELKPDEKNARSHRGKAVRALCGLLREANV